jgi:hypothetical protein
MRSMEYIRCPFVGEKMYIPVRALNPDSLNPDPDTNPDPAFQVNRDQIRILGFDDQKLRE